MDSSASVRIALQKLGFISSSLPAPAPEKQVAFLEGRSLVLGDEITETGEQTGREVKVSFIGRESALYISGNPGMGKSSLLESMIYQEALVDEAIFVIDPAWDLIKNVIAQLPQKSLKKTYLLDLNEEDHFFGLNLFDGAGTLTRQQKTLAVERVMRIFQKIFEGDRSGILLETYLEYIAHTLLDVPGATIADIPRLLFHDTHRARMLTYVKDEYVLDFWKREYAEMSPSERRREFAPLKRRLTPFFLNDTMRHIITQKKTTINFRKAIEEKRIVLIHLDKVTFKKTADVIGTWLLSEMFDATFSFKNVDREKRPGFSVYVDEFNNFVTADFFSKLIEEGRKYGIRLTLAHVNRHQLSDATKSATLKAGTIISFRQDEAQARELSAPFFDRKQKPRVARLYYDVLKRLPTHPNEAIYRFSQEVVGTLEEWRDKKDDKASDISYEEERTRAQKALTLLERLLLEAEQGVVKESRWKGFLQEASSFFDYEETYAEERMDKAQDTIQRIQSDLEKFPPYPSFAVFLACFYRFFFGNTLDFSREVTLKQIKQLEYNPEFWNSFQSAGESLINIQRVQRVLVKHAQYVFSLPKPWDLPGYLASLRQTVAMHHAHIEKECKRLKSIIWDTIGIVHALRYAYIWAEKKPVEYERWKAEWIRSPDFDKTLYPYYEQWFMGYTFAENISPSGWKFNTFWPPKTTEIFSTLDYPWVARGILNPAVRKQLKTICTQMSPLIEQLAIWHKEEEKLAGLLLSDNSLAYEYVPDWDKKKQQWERDCVRYEERIQLFGMVEGLEDPLFILYKEHRDWYNKRVDELEKQMNTALSSYKSNAYEVTRRKKRVADFLAILTEVVKILVDEPLGEYEKIADKAVIDTLMNLDQQEAFVRLGRSGKAETPILRIRTKPRPVTVDRAEQKRRLRYIRKRTCNEYCLSREGIDQQQPTKRNMVSPEDTPGASPSSENDDDAPIFPFEDEA